MVRSNNNNNNSRTYNVHMVEKSHTGSQQMERRQSCLVFIDEVKQVDF